MTTLKDLSKHLGISVTQVSRALNNHWDVSEETKEKVRKAAKELGYQPNRTARSLVTGRTGTICLIRSGHLMMPDDASVFEVITGLSLEFSNRGLQFVLHMTPPEKDPLDSYRQAVASGSFDGFVLIEAQVNDPRVKLLSEAGKPFVMHGRSEANPSHAFFDIDNFQVALFQTRHLTSQGHRRIALLNGLDGFAYSQGRLDGYRQALVEAGVEFDPGLVFSGPMIEERGRSAVRALWDRPGPKPTAIVCSNILLAKGVYSALDDLGMRIPDDVSVIAHDDVLRSIRASEFHPAVTLTRSAFDKSWSHLADILCAIIEKKTDQRSQIVDEFEFVDGGSTASPKNS